MIIYLIIGVVYTFLMDILLDIDNNRMNWGERIISFIFWPVFLYFWLKNMYNTFFKGK
jgi:hypothetical protein